MPTVLYAEDDHEHRLMMGVVLQPLDITFLIAKNGFEALEIVKAEKPDLVLLDLFMPKIDGFGVLKAIKSNAETCDTAVIILSAWPTGDNRRRAEQAGAIDFVPKPYEPQVIVDLVKAQLIVKQGTGLLES